MNTLLRALTITVIFTLFVFAFVTWRFWKMDQEFIADVQQDLEIQSLTDEIIHLGEVLTMSARMGATTGDLNWELHYEEFVPQQSTTIRNLLDMTPVEKREDGIRKTYKANVRKVEMERKAFEFVKQDLKDKALGHLSSEEYRLIRQNYKDGLAEHDINIHDQVHDRLLMFEERQSFFVVMVMIGVVLLSVFWIIIIVLMRRELIRRKQTESALRESERKLRKIIDTVPHMIFAKDEEGTFLLVNEATAKAYGATVEELVGFKHEEFHPSDPQMEMYKIEDLEVLHRKKEKIIPAQDFLDRTGQTRILQVIKIPFRIPNVTDNAVLGVAVDITEQKKAEEKLLHSAFYDSLTDLPTRTLFLDKLGEAISKLKKDSEYHFAVFYIDLDRFKIVNDSLGHLKGDELLISVAYRLRKHFKDLKEIARVGGDEFTLLFEGVKDREEAEKIALEIQSLFSNAFDLNGHEVFTSVSIGIVMSDFALISATDILRGADTAMYVAKNKGRRRHEFFDLKMHKRAISLLELENDLRNAVERNELFLYFQPIVSVHTEGLAGFECLVRWNHPTQGLVSPGDFIPVAEESGMIIPISEWVLETAFAQLATWKETFGEDFPYYVSVNISVRQLHQPDIIPFLKSLIRKYDIKKDIIRLEITENVLLDHSEVVLANIESLKNLGVQLYLDDFGTGYSSLSLLKRLDFAKLKIDKSFVTTLDKNEDNVEIVQGVLALAHNLGIEVIAEGIEDQAVLDKLRGMGCDYAQGYFFSEPLNKEETTEYIKKSFDRD